MDNYEIGKTMKESIVETANTSIAQLLQEIETYRAQELAQYRESVEQEARQYLESKMNELELLSTKMASQAKLQIKRDLMVVRQELVESLFAQAKQRILAFSNSDLYEEFLTSKLSKLYQNDWTIYVKASDVALVKTIVSKLKLQATVESSVLIQLGGFLAVSEDGLVEADMTLDSALANQREWFQNHSGLTV